MKYRKTLTALRPFLKARKELVDMRIQFGLPALFLACLLAVWTPAAYAVPHTLTDGNSTVQVNPNTQAGVFDWVVDGTDHLFQQWFWFRTGAMTSEASIDTLILTTETQPTANILQLLYTGTDFDILITYLLSGGTTGSNTSDLAESIRIRNNGLTPLAFNFFQYSDFDIGDTSDDDFVDLVNPNLWEQSDPNFALVGSIGFSTPTRCWAAPSPDIVNSLNDGLPTTLPGNNLNAADTNCGPLGPIDATWAWQWSFLLPTGGTFIISKDKLITPLAVPEPGTLALFGIGLLLGFAARHRRGRSA
jgi:hypothetical protein